MELTEHSCNRCGGTLASIGENRWKCPYCGRVYDEEAAVKNTKTMREMFDDVKMETVKNLRRNLYDAVNAEYISSTDVKGACVALKKYLPDDFAANFYEIACGNNLRALTQHIRKINVEENLDEIESVIVFLIKSLQSAYLLELNNLVEKAYKNRDLQLYEKYATLISVEAEKVQNGIYETKLPREVFIAYSSKDMDKVSELCEVLEAQGLHCFVAARNLRHGKGSVENYDAALKEAMDHCKSFVFVSSMNSRQFSCDALGIELPYIESIDRANSPAEYRNNYISIPHKYKKPRVEYRIEESRGFNAADSITNEFFDGYERVYSPEEVAKRILKQLVEAPMASDTPAKASGSKASTSTNTGAAPKTSTPINTSTAPKMPTLKKICTGCGTENDSKTNYCIKCGGKQFVSSVDDYIRIKNAQELAANRRREAEIAAAKAAELAAKKPAEPPKKKSMGGAVAAVIIIAVIVVIIIAIASSAGSRNNGNETIPDYDYNIGINGDNVVIYPGQSESNGMSGEDWICEGTEGNFYYSVTRDGVMTVSGSGEMREFFEGGAAWENNGINASDGSWLGYPCDFVHTLIIEEGVTYIGGSAFDGFDQLKNVQLASSVKGIGERAFNDCNSLENIDLSNVTRIGGSAFAYCYNLSSVTLGDEVEYVGSDAFWDTSALNNDLYDDGVAVWGSALIKLNNGVDISYASNLLGNITCIADYACSGVSGDGSLSLTLPSTLRCIGEYAFYDCEFFSSLTIPSSVVSIGKYAFEGCDNLQSIVLEEGSQLESIGEGAFRYCYSLSNVTFPKTVLITEIKDQTFYDCDSLVEVKIPSSVTKIGANAFNSCASLAMITVPTSVASIGESAFSSCYYLEAIMYFGTEDMWNLISKGSWWNDGAGSSVSDGYESGGMRIIFLNGEYDPDSDDIKTEEYTPGLSFSINSEGTGYIVRSYSGSEGDVVIPSFYYGLPVIEISSSVFSNFDVITSVTIPASVTKIGENAFYNAYNLEKVTFADGSMLSEIGGYAFRNCDKLAGLFIPKSVTLIGTYAIAQCDLLESVEFEEGSVIETLPQNLFYESKALKTVNIPDSVVTIGSEAFRDTAIESVALGENSKLTTLGDSAFYGCSELKRLTLPATLTSIGYWVFSGCSNIEYASVPADYIDDVKGEKLKVVIINSGEEIPSYALQSSKVESVTIADGVKTVGAYAFANCQSLKTVIFGAQVETIDTHAFEGCVALESIELPQSVTAMGSNVFERCTSLTAISLPGSITSLGSYIFNECTALSEVTLGEGLTEISYGMFTSCATLKEIKIPSTVTSIREYAFQYSGIEKIALPEGLSEIPYYTFASCPSFEEIIIPDSVTTVDSGAFYQSEPKKITCPIDVLSVIPKSNLEHIVITNGVSGTDVIPSNIFQDCKKLQSVVLPDVQDLIIGSYAFSGCISLASITLPENLDDISEWAFDNCTSLVEVINHSSLEIAIGESTDRFGSVAANALIIHSGESLLREVDGFVFITVEGNNYLVSYIGNDTELVLPENYNGESYQLRESTFKGNSKLTSITVSGVESIPQNAFNNCDALTSVTIGDGVKFICENAFTNCDSLHTVVIGNDVVSIGEQAFYCCYQLKNLTLGSSLESIGYYAFSKCYYALARVTIPVSVTYIGGYAFYDCTQLVGVKFEDSSATWGIYSSNESDEPSDTITVSSSTTNADNLTSNLNGYVWKKINE